MRSPRYALAAGRVRHGGAPAHPSGPVRPGGVRGVADAAGARVVCHVAARQDRAANDSTFAEGLLDWVAYRYLEYWAVKLDRELAPAARKHAESLRDVLTRADTPEGWARRVGHRAAEHLRVWFETECDLDPLESPLMIARLAVELNKVDRSLADKDAFVSMLGPPVPPLAAQALRRWESGLLTAAELLAEVVPSP